VTNLRIDTETESRYRSAAKMGMEDRLQRAIHGVIFVIVMLGLGLPSTASLAQQQGTPAEDKACRPDVMRLCRDAAPDTGRVLACLQSQRARLSRACRTVLQQHGV
jgi:Cysteine rich repeat